MQRAIVGCPRVAIVEDGRAGAARTDARVRAVARAAVVGRMEEEACLELVLVHTRLAVAHDLDVVSGATVSVGP